MKNTLTLLYTLLLLSTTAFGQSELKTHKAGHTFEIGLPDYMSRTFGLNDAASIQYKSTVKDSYGFIIFDTKEELELAEMKFSSVQEFYDDFIKDFLKDEKKRVVSQPLAQTKGDIHFVESDVTYYDKEAKTDIYYLVGIVETQKSFYKVLSWTTAENKNKVKADFQKILYSIKD